MTSSPTRTCAPIPAEGVEYANWKFIAKACIYVDADALGFDTTPGNAANKKKKKKNTSAKPNVNTHVPAPQTPAQAQVPAPQAPAAQQHQ